MTGFIFDCPKGCQTDRRFGGLLGLLANHDFLTAISVDMEQDLLGRDTAVESDVVFMLLCVAEAKQEMVRLYPSEYCGFGETDGNLSMLNAIEESLLRYQADMRDIALPPPDDESIQTKTARPETGKAPWL